MRIYLIWLTSTYLDTNIVSYIILNPATKFAHDSAMTINRSAMLTRVNKLRQIFVDGLLEGNQANKILRRSGPTAIIALGDGDSEGKDPGKLLSK